MVLALALWLPPETKLYRESIVISFIVPAHNEEALIGRTLLAIRDSAQSLDERYEIIVVNDSSNDRTGQIALENGARVIDVNHRQIAATRNSGAISASGELFIFVDADTMVTKRALRAALRALRSGAVGGGCTVRFDGKVPTYAMVLERLLPPFMQLLGLAGGCFLFCRRDAYFAAGGFNESMYCAEEVAFASQLKRRGRFVVLRDYVITSARKLRTRTALDLIKVGTRLALGGKQSFQSREGLEYWYGPRE